MVQILTSEYREIIEGGGCPTASDGTFYTRNPATDEVLKETTEDGREYTYRVVGITPNAPSTLTQSTSEMGSPVWKTVALPRKTPRSSRS